MVSQDQWFHIVGYTVDDMRIHWAFPSSPDVRGGVWRGDWGRRDMVCELLSRSLQAQITVSRLRKEFEQPAWHGVGGKYAHRTYGYLLPPSTGGS